MNASKFGQISIFFAQKKQSQNLQITSTCKKLRLKVHKKPNPSIYSGKFFSSIKKQSKRLLLFNKRIVNQVAAVFFLLGKNVCGFCCCWSECSLWMRGSRLMWLKTKRVLLLDQTIWTVWWANEMPVVYLLPYKMRIIIMMMMMINETVSGRNCMCVRARKF